MQAITTTVNRERDNKKFALSSFNCVHIKRKKERDCDRVTELEGKKRKEKERKKKLSGEQFWRQKS